MVYYFSVEWPERWEVERYNWRGSITNLARINTHAQQICGISWSKDGELFATGGNDNHCCLFETKKVLMGARGFEWGREATGDDVDRQPPPNPDTDVNTFIQGDEKHRWRHLAAVKAIAFCPWQEGLVAVGGGSNDKCIHFYHTTSGAPLATISVSAQVTSLIWSTKKREIAATFGYAQPDHCIRIAVFSWPDCRQVAAIPFAPEFRALYAIPYPGFAGASPGTRSRDPRMEGCIMVASSDKSVKFHEVWGKEKRTTAGGAGMLTSSDILESLEGIDREGDVIR